VDGVRISVECGGFTRAADACLTANQIAAVLTLALGTRLAGTAGMAGDDATSTDFATAYDAGAAEATAALADLTDAFAGAGRLLAATRDHHRRAESAAAGVPDDGGGRVEDEVFARIGSATTPSSLGAQEPSLGRVETWILDQVEGFVWPGADVAALREAASAWRRAAASTAGLADHVDAATALLELQRSPEVPLAVDVLADLGAVVGDTAWQLASLGTACEDYAVAVEATRDRTRALLAEVAQMVVEGAAVSVLVAGLSGGTAGGAAAAAAAARVRALAPRFHALLTALRAGVATVAARLERARDELSAVRARLDGLARVPARDEAGTLKHPGAWFPDRRPGWLRSHEVPGHTIGRHVGLSERQLRERLQDHPRLRRASAFDDESSAERLIAQVLQRRSADIDAWLANPTGRITLVEDLAARTGLSVGRDGSVHAPTGLRVILQADGSAPNGWRILTAFPD